MSKRVKTIQLYSGQWSPIANKGYHECCDCGLTHSVAYRLHDGVMFEKWSVNKTATRASRKRNKRKKS